MIHPPVYKRGTIITRETRMFKARQQAISIFVLRNLLLYSGTVWSPSSQSWYGVAKLKFWITWRLFFKRLSLLLNSTEVKIFTMSMARL